MSRNKSRIYDKEFERNPVNLYLSSNRPYEQVSDELGIPVGTLVTWVQAHKKNGAEASPGKGCLKPSNAEVAQLRKEIAIAREE